MPDPEFQGDLFPSAQEPAPGGTYLQIAPSAPVHKLWTYHAPAGFGDEFHPGQRVAIPVGRANRREVGFVIRKARPDETAGGRHIKPILEVIDRLPLMSPAVYDLAVWMSEFYCSPLGAALAAVVPAAVKKHAGDRLVRLLSLAPAIENAPPPTPKQSLVLDALAALGREVRPEELIAAAKCSDAVIRKLIALNRIIQRQVRASDLEEPVAPSLPRPRPAGLTPTAEQDRALATVSGLLEPSRFGVVLLYGVTGSGKTEVYLRAIEQVVRAGRQAIVLVPEISLTPQTRTRFEHRFGSVAVLHSHLSETARHHQWRRIASGEASVVVGARSAVFAPCPNPGIIVVDEEHESSFKQHDPAPRYHARDVAIKRASMQAFPVLLGSATPSLEMLHNCEARKDLYTRVDLTQRVDSLPMPPVSVVDMRQEIRRRPGVHVLSLELQTEMRHAFDRGEQAILLLNRRGHSTFLLCPKCGYVLQCDHCDVALVWHETAGMAMCHYCGSGKMAPGDCPACPDGTLKRLGMGTQRLEQELARVFPDIPAARLDADTAGSMESVLTRFGTGDLKLLFGTQMIAKGLHFPRVTVVGVVSADTALSTPDFRAGERTFQMISQVAGRAGRSHLGGRVVVQTFEPTLPPIVFAATHDYFGFAEHELRLRKEFGFPPFARLVSFVLRDEDFARAQRASVELFARLKALVDEAKLPITFKGDGPVPAPLGKLSDKHRFLIVAAAVDPRPLQALLSAGRRERLFEGDGVVVDVDPTAIL